MRLITIIIALWYCGEIFSQEESFFQKKKHLTFSIGLDRSLLNDELLSALNYSGTYLSLDLKYDIKKEKKHQSIYLFYSQPKFGNKSNNNSIIGNTGYLTYKYRVRIDKLSLFKSKLYFGGYIKVKGYVRNKVINTYRFSFLAGQGGEGFVSLGANSILAKNITNKSVIQLEFDFALASYLINRNTYLTEEQKFLAANKLIDYNFGLTYELLSSKKLSFIVNYNFNFYKYSHIITGISNGTHSLMLGAKLKLFKP